jgi:hypothetical protein
MHLLLFTFPLTRPSFQHQSLDTELDLTSTEAWTLPGPLHLGPRYLLLSNRVGPQNDEYVAARRELMRETQDTDEEDPKQRKGVGEDDRKENGIEWKTDDVCWGNGLG